MNMHGTNENKYANLSYEEIVKRLEDGIIICNETERETVLNSMNILTNKQRKKRLNKIIGGTITSAIFLIIVLFLNGKIQMLMSAFCDGWSGILNKLYG